MTKPEDILQTAYELADRYPDNVYQRPRPDFCSYFEGDNTVAPETGCLIGQAIRTVMPEATERLRESEGKGISQILYELFDPADVKNDVQYQLNTMQARQDDRAPWGQAAADARSCTLKEPGR